MSALIFLEGGVFCGFWSVEEICLREREKKKLSDPYNLITYPQEEYFDPLSQYIILVAKYWCECVKIYKSCKGECWHKEVMQSQVPIDG